MLNGPDSAWLELLAWLETQGYDFVTPTPATHARVLARRQARPGRSLRDILGWSLPFHPAEAEGLVTRLAAAGALTEDDGVARSRVRVSRLKAQLFIHSAYPTDAEDAVFFGPDSYRFADFVTREVDEGFNGRAVDVGGGCGAGAIALLTKAPAAQVQVTDVNVLALRFARLSAQHAGLDLQVAEAEGLRAGDRDLDLVLGNPPYMAASAQTYRDGGDMGGAGLSLAWAQAALGRLKPGGRLLLYTGSAIVEGGRDRLRRALEALCAAEGAAINYQELDPDVFGEELEKPAYADVERIALIGCVITAAPR